MRPPPAAGWPTRMLLAGHFMVCKTPQRAVNWLQGSVGVEHDVMPPSAAELVERILLQSSVSLKQRD